MYEELCPPYNMRNRHVLWKWNQLTFVYTLSVVTLIVDSYYPEDSVYLSILLLLHAIVQYLNYIFSYGKHNIFPLSLPRIMGHVINDEEVWANKCATNEN